MVLAQKKLVPGDLPRENSQSGPDGGIGKVLSSIQGLQQRLDAFSLEEATQSEQTACELIHRLKALQAQLTLVQKLTRVITETKRTVSEIPGANFDLVAPGDFDNQPRLRATIQAGKLIRMHRSMQVACASAAPVSVDFDPSLKATSSEIDNRVVNDLVSASGIQANDDAERREAETKSAPINETAPTDNVILVPDLTLQHEGPLTPKTDPATAKPSAPTSTYHFKDFTFDGIAESIPAAETFVFPDKSLAIDQPLKVKKSKSAPTNGHFDERLLNDLIDTYGEFVVEKRLTGGIETTPELNPSLTSETGSVTQLPAILNVALVPLDVDSEASLRSSRIEEDLATVVETNAPNVKKRSEIDRLLKSIIKDYGEYDLYSHPKPSKFNKGTAIVAFIVLGLVLGGFYLFKSPPPDTRPLSNEIIAPQTAASGSTSNRLPKAPQP